MTGRIRDTLEFTGPGLNSASVVHRPRWQRHPIAAESDRTRPALTRPRPRLRQIVERRRLRHPHQGFLRPAALRDPRRRMPDDLAIAADRFALGNVGECGGICLLRAAWPSSLPPQHGPDQATVTNVRTARSPNPCSLFADDLRSARCARRVWSAAGSARPARRPVAARTPEVVPERQLPAAN